MSNLFSFIRCYELAVDLIGKLVPSMMTCDLAFQLAYSVSLFTPYQHLWAIILRKPTKFAYYVDCKKGLSSERPSRNFGHQSGRGTKILQMVMIDGHRKLGVLPSRHNRIK